MTKCSNVVLETQLTTPVPPEVALGAQAVVPIINKKGQREEMGEIGSCKPIHKNKQIHDITDPKEQEQNISKSPHPVGSSNGPPIKVLESKSSEEDTDKKPSTKRSGRQTKPEVTKSRPPKNGFQKVAIEDLMEILYEKSEPLSYGAFADVFKGRGVPRKILLSRWKSYWKSYYSKKYQCSNYAVTDFVSKQSNVNNGRPRRHIKQVKRLSPIFKRKGMVPIGSGKNPWVKTAEGPLPAHIAKNKRRQEDITRKSRSNSSPNSHQLLHTWPKKNGVKRRRLDQGESLSKKISRVSSVNNDVSQLRTRPQREKKEVTRLSPIFRRGGYVAVHDPELKAHQKSYTQLSALEEHDLRKAKLMQEPDSRKEKSTPKHLTTPKPSRKASIGATPKRHPSSAPSRASKRISRRPTRKLPGVSWSNHRERFEAETSHQGIKMHIGYFITEGEAWDAISEYRKRMGWPQRDMPNVPSVRRPKLQLGVSRKCIKRKENDSSEGSSEQDTSSRKSDKSDDGTLLQSEVKVGLRLDARDRDGRWWLAKVLEVKCRERGRRNMTALVHFRGWNKKFDTWLPLKNLARIHTHTAELEDDEDDTHFQKTKEYSANEKKDIGRSDEYARDCEEDEQNINESGSEGENDGAGEGKSERRSEMRRKKAANKRPRPDYSTRSAGEKLDRTRQKDLVASNGVYIGIWPQRKRWRACISHNGIRMHLGSYETAELAARAWDAKARELRGARTKTNFPLSVEKARQGQTDEEHETKKSSFRAAPTRKRPAKKSKRPTPLKLNGTSRSPPKSGPSESSSTPVNRGPTGGVQALSKPKPAVPWCDDLTPRSSRRAKPKNYRLMEKGNFNEIFALQLKAFRMRNKSQRSPVDRDEGGRVDTGEDEKSSMKKVGDDKVKKKIDKGWDSDKGSAKKKRDSNSKKKDSGRKKSGSVAKSRSRSREREYAEVDGKMNGKHELRARTRKDVSPSSSRSRSPMPSDDGLQKVGSGSGIFSAGEILAIFAGASSVDGEKFWLFECGQPSDGSHATGFYYRKNTSNGSYERDPNAPRQRISIDSVMRDFRGHYVTFKHNTDPPQRFLTLASPESTRLLDLAAEIIKMQGLNPTGANTVTDDDLLAQVTSGDVGIGNDNILNEPNNPHANEINEEDQSPSAIEARGEGGPDDVLGLGELPMQLRNFFAEDDTTTTDTVVAASTSAAVSAEAAGLAATAAAVAVVSAGSNSDLFAAAVNGADEHDSIIRSDGMMRSEGIILSNTNEVADSLPDINYKTGLGDAMGFSDAEGDKVASMFLS
eukprot:jgi/Bigna1/81660/fgenesh1_pg.82_\